MVTDLVLRTLFTYFFVLLCLRIMGKREIGKLSVFDLVVSIIIAEVSAVSLQDLRISVWHGVFVIALLVALQITVSFLSMHSRRIHDLIEGKPTVLIAGGEINDSEMKRTRYNMNDLLMQLREKNIATVADVEFAILETSGKLSVFPKAGQRPVTPDDLVMTAAPTVMTTSLIVDGCIDDDKLAGIGKSRVWLQEQLVAQGYTGAKEVFYAGWDGSSLHVDRMDDDSLAKKCNPLM